MKDNCTIDWTLHYDYRRKLKAILSQYYEQVLVARELVGLPLKYRRSIEPPQPALSSGDGRGDGDVRQQRQPSLAAPPGGSWGWRHGGEPPPPHYRGGIAACEEGQQRQETINLIALDELIELFARSG